MKALTLKKLKVLSIALFAMIGTTVALDAIVYEPLPNRPYWRGFYYCLDMADYPNFLQSNMPLEVMIGYIVADSAARVAPYPRYVRDSIERLNLLSDTANYILKYWYLMNEYDPLRFQAFLKRKEYNWRHNPNASFSGPGTFHSALRSRMVANPKSVYVTPHYILHIYVNNTVWIDTVDTRDTWDGVKSRTIVFSEVLDTLKGGRFPSLENAIIWNGERQNSETGIVDISYALPQQTDIVFSYMNCWQRWRSGPDLYDKHTGENWIQPNREYIVFLEPLGIDAIGSWDPIGSPHKLYYSLIPYAHRSMYPIIDGYVLDERNTLGFGTKVPVDEFKDNIRRSIEEIKKFGE